jgi:hypothetical protein
MSSSTVFISPRAYLHVVKICIVVWGGIQYRRFSVLLMEILLRQLLYPRDLLRLKLLLALGIHGISNLREILQMDSTFKVAPEIKIDLKRNIEYYRVSLVTDFFHRSKDIKITYALLKVQLVSSSDTIKPEIYSISLLRVK